MTKSTPLAVLLVSTGGYVDDDGVEYPKGEVVTRIAWDGVTEYKSPFPNTEIQVDNGRQVYKPPQPTPEPPDEKLVGAVGALVAAGFITEEKASEILKV